MKIWLLSIAILLISIQSFGNAAMPGMWQTGHGGRFIPLFKEDSIHFGKIQMQKELVVVNLYPGFAVVKGEYWMYNTTDEPITMRAGYPINGQYNQELVDNVMFDDIYSLKVLINDQQTNYRKPMEGYDSAYRVIEKNDMQMRNWYYWSCTFAPRQLTKITVYFLTNNSNTGLRSGYSVDKGNGFAYILETGKAWAGKIEQGQVLFHLKNGLTLKDIKGVYPNGLTGDDTHLKFSFTNLEPDSSNNILLWYKSKTENFDFNAINKNAEQYYKEIDAFPVAEFNSTQFKAIDKSDFKVHDNTLTWVIVGIIAVVITGIVIVILLLRWLYKLIFKKKRY